MFGFARPSPLFDANLPLVEEEAIPLFSYRFEGVDDAVSREIDLPPDGGTTLKEVLEATRSDVGAVRERATERLDTMLTAPGTRDRATDQLAALPRFDSLEKPGQMLDKLEAMERHGAIGTEMADHIAAKNCAADLPQVAGETKEGLRRFEANDDAYHSELRSTLERYGTLSEFETSGSLVAAGMAITGSTGWSEEAFDAVGLEMATVAGGDVDR